MVQLTPDEIAAVVLARRGPGWGLRLLSIATWLTWLIAAGLTTFVCFNTLARLDSTSRLLLVPVAKEPGEAKGLEPAADAPKVPGKEVILVYGPRDKLIQIRPPTTQEYLLGTAYREQLRGQALVKLAYALTLTCAAIVLALLATVSLLTATRRATLRQIRASLADITRQLDALQARGTG